jgi:hypothetical protein
MALRFYWAGLTRKQRICAGVGLFCLINGIYSTFGYWGITVGLSADHGGGVAQAERSGVFAWGGFLVLAFRDSWWMTSNSNATPYPSLDLYRELELYELAAPLEARMVDYRRPPWPQDHHLLGIVVATGNNGTSSYRNEGIAIHWAYPTLAFAIPPLLALIKLHRERRRSAGNHCRVCGYDLRASPNYCPECGTVPKKFQYSS